MTNNDPAPASLLLQTERVAKGGAMLGRDDGGRVVFVEGAIPGETVRVELTKQKKSFANGFVVSVESPSADRRQPPCVHVDEGCGGCDWQHIVPDRQSELRREVVIDGLKRIAKLDNPAVEASPYLPTTGYRTTLRLAVHNGKAGFRQRASHQVGSADSCIIAHPLALEIIQQGRFPGAKEVTVRVGANTGERLVLVSPTAAGATVPDDVILIGTDELEKGREAFYHEEVAGIRYRVSADSFFQCRADGAAALISLVRDGLTNIDGPLLDAYCGVGLFAAALGEGRPVFAVESSRSSVADAAVNLGSSAEIVRSRFERWMPQPAAAVIADPARSGLDRAGVGVIDGTGAKRLVLVSCDPAAQARDTSLLIQTGFALERVTAVDLFGETSHIEAVSVFNR